MKTQKVFVLTLSEEEAAALRQLWGKSTNLPAELMFLGEIDNHGHFDHLSGINPSWRARFEKR